MRGRRIWWHIVGKERCCDFANLRIVAVDCCEVHRVVGGILIVGEVIVVSFMLSSVSSGRNAGSL